MWQKLFSTSKFEKSHCSSSLRRWAVKMFYQKRKLRHHMKSVHQGEKPFKCNECDLCFSRKDKFKRHIISVHVGENPFKCDVCDKNFSQKGGLKKHILSVHEGEKPSKCF